MLLALAGVSSAAMAQQKPVVVEHKDSFLFVSDSLYRV